LIGVLIVSGIVFYALVYSGASSLPGTKVNDGVPVSTLGALMPKASAGKPPATPKPKPLHPGAPGR
jgi:hypothetical protein